MRLSSLILVISATLLSCAGSAPEPTRPQVTGPFLGMTPVDTPTLLAPSLLASLLTEYNGTFNPEGTEFYFTSEGLGKSVISMTKMQADQQWTQPVAAAFSSEFSEYDPLFTPDGKRIYFSSQRPIEPDGPSRRTNIWFVERNGEGWSSPTYVKLTEQGDYYSSVTNDGTIYFNVWDNGDVYQAIPSDTGYIITPLSATLNDTGSDIGDPFIAPDESYLIYRGFANSFGRGDHYISFQIDGQWTEPQNLGEPLNSFTQEMCPYVTVDGRFFIFSSQRVKELPKVEPLQELDSFRNLVTTIYNGRQNIYYISADFISEMRSVAKLPD